jgi:hypothetical protein
MLDIGEMHAALSVMTTPAAPVGVCLPLLSHKVRWLRVGGMPFAVGRAFSAGVVLATGFVHMFPEALEALGNPCLGWIGAHCFLLSVVRPTVRVCAFQRPVSVCVRLNPAATVCLAHVGSYIITLER